MHPLQKPFEIIAQIYSSRSRFFSSLNNQLTGGIGVNKLIFRNESFGNDQEAYLKLISVDPATTRISLLLKAQGNNYDQGVLRVSYQPSNQVVLVVSYTLNQGWTQHAEIPAPFQPGDLFGARAKADGSVESLKDTHNHRF